MADDTGGPGGLRERYASIDARLDGEGAGPARQALKGEIVSLFKAVEHEIAELTTLREEIRGLVDRWKAHQAVAAPLQAPEFIAERPMLHQDHIGASTFVEKGWSRLSLGEYAGAEESLAKALALSPNRSEEHTSELQSQ